MPLNPARSLRRFACLALLSGVAGCAGLNDPFQREGTWQPENVNDANIAAMVANPQHLQQGVGDDASPGALGGRDPPAADRSRQTAAYDGSRAGRGHSNQQQSAPAGITQ